MISNDYWGSVRKVRYYKDIINTINFAIKNENKIFNEVEFRKYVVDYRKKDMDIITRHYSKINTKSIRTLNNSKFDVTLPDTLTFFKNTNFFKISCNKITLQKGAMEIKNNNSVETLNIIIKYILQSKYKAYVKYILNLININEFSTNYRKRDKKFREIINSKGFKTDTASFYTIRDILYELRLLNWYMDDAGYLKVYPTCDITNNKNEEYYDKIIVDEQIILYNKRINKERFKLSIINNYLNYTHRYGLEMSLIKLRDLVCRELLIDDIKFKENINDLYGEDVTSQIVLTFGTMIKQQLNYGLKILNLPKLSNSRFALYIRINNGGL